MHKKEVCSGIIILLLNIFFLIIFSSSVFSAYWTSLEDAQIACRKQYYRGSTSTMKDIVYNKVSCPTYTACKDYGTYYLNGATIYLWCNDNVYVGCNSNPACCKTVYNQPLGYTNALYSTCEKYVTGLSAECVAPTIIGVQPGQKVECNYLASGTKCTNGHCNGAGKCIPLVAAFTYTSNKGDRGWVFLDARASTDPDSSITSYKWESTAFISPTTETVAYYNHFMSYLPNNNYNCQSISVKLTITDEDENTNSVTKTICVWKDCPSCTCQTCASMGYNCGSYTEPCGNTSNCGSCSSGNTCVSNKCVQNCSPKCLSLGYSVGTCTSTNYVENSYSCSGSTCRWSYNKITGTSCSSNCWCYKSSACGTSSNCPTLCTATGCCTPNCVGKTCGDNGCGGSCGACTSPAVCFNNNCCTPNCTGKTCGSNGCGGTCPPGCTSPSTCVNNQCTCVPSCTGKTCGSDGCGSNNNCGSCTSPSTCVNNQCKLPCSTVCTNLGYTAGTCTATNYQEGAFNCYGTSSCYYKFHDETANSDCASGTKCWCYNKSIDCSDIANCPAYCTSTGCTYCKSQGQACTAGQCCSGLNCNNGFCCASGNCCSTSANCPLNQYCSVNFNCAACPANKCTAVPVNGGANCLSTEYGRYSTGNHCALACETELESLEACQICNNKYFLIPSFHSKVLSDIQVKINNNLLSPNVITKKGCCLRNNDCVYDGLCIQTGAKLDVDLDLRQEVCSI